uniref:C2 domain-containing protein n=1 Tax=Schistocephalus solidus TaxID=70667 RepID=A0A0X3PFH5_SCHSO
MDTMVTLEGVKRGKVHLKLTWLDLSTIPADLNATKSDSDTSPALKSNSTAYLFVRVEQAKNLSRVKFVQEPSPYCILQLGNNIQNTFVKERTQNPLWESIHHFILSNPEIERLNIEIRDSRTEFLLGTCGIPLKHLMAESDMTVTRPYTLNSATNEGAVLYLHMELRMLVPGRDRRGDGKSRSKSASPNLEQSDSPSRANGQAPPGSDDMLVRQRTVDPRVVTPYEPTAGVMPSASPPSPMPSDESLQDHWEDEDRSFPGPSRSPSPSHQGTSAVERASTMSTISGAPQGVAPPNPSGKLRLTLHYNVDLEILEITVHRIEGLRGVNKHGLADSYVKLILLHSNHADLDDSKKTKVVYGELNPVFEESFDFAIRQQELDFCTLRIEVKQHSKLFSRKSSMPLLGTTSIDLRTLEVGRGCTEWYWLTGFCNLSSRRSRTPSTGP